MNSRSEAAGAESWLTPGRFAGLLALLLFALYPDVVLGWRAFYYRDYQIFGYAWASCHRDAFWRGEIPLWTPLSDCGLPFLAQWNTLTLYPGSLFYLLLPLSWSLGVFCLLHLVLAGAGMYCLARAWTRSRLAAAFAGTVFAVNGLTLNALMWPNNIAALGWMPWVIWLSDKAWRQGGKAMVPAALAAALQVLSGAPEVTLVTWMFIGLWWIRLAVRAFQAEPLSGSAPAGDDTAGQPLPSVGRLAGRFLVVGLLAAGLTAAQMLPFLELLLQSQRDGAFGQGLWAMPPWGAGNFLVPLFFTFPWGKVWFQYDQYWTTSYYVGIGTIAMALAALPSARRRPVLFLLGVVLLGLVLAMGDQGFLYGALKRALPVFGFMRYPVKFVVLCVLALPLLAACGLADLEEQASAGRRWRRRLLWSVLAVLGGVALVLWVARFHPVYQGRYNCWLETWRNGLSRAVLLVAFSGCVAAVLGLTAARTRLLAGLLLLGVAWLDAFTHMPLQNPTISRAVYDPLPDLHSWSPAPAPGESRAFESASAEAAMHHTTLDDPEEDFLRKRTGLYCNCNLLDGIPKVNGVFSLHLRATEQFLGRLYARSNPPLALLDFLGVSQVTAPGKTATFEARATHMPLATSGQMPVFAGPEETLRGLFDGDFDPRRTVFMPPEARGAIAATNGAGARILRGAFASHRISLETEAPEPALVVVAHSYYPRWQARVDGQTVPLWRANHAFQALEVPAGRHRIVVRYQDPFFLTGSIISGGGVGVALIGLWLKRTRNGGVKSLDPPV